MNKLPQNYQQINFADLTKTRERTENFSTEEKWMLIAILKKYEIVDTIDNPKCDTQTICEKKAAWKFIVDHFNVRAGTLCRKPRNMSHLKDLWKRLKQKCRRTMADLRLQSESFEIQVDNSVRMVQIVAVMIHEEMPSWFGPIEMPKELLNIAFEDDVKPDFDKLQLLAAVAPPDTPKSASSVDTFVDDSSNTFPASLIEISSDIADYEAKQEETSAHPVIKEEVREDGIGKIASVSSIANVKFAGFDTTNQKRMSDESQHEQFSVFENVEGVPNMTVSSKLASLAASVSTSTPWSSLDTNGVPETKRQRRLPEISQSNHLCHFQQRVSSPCLKGVAHTTARTPSLMPQYAMHTNERSAAGMSSPMSQTLSHTNEGKDPSRFQNQSEISLMRRLEHDEQMTTLKRQKKNAKLEKKVLRQKLQNLKAENKAIKLRTAILKLEKEKLELELKKSD